MTATRDRKSDPDSAAPAAPAWDERALFGSFRGLPWWGAILVALGASTVGAIVDLQRQDALGLVFTIGYTLGCVVAVALVRRRNLFGPMVQPPLVFAFVFVTASVIGMPAKANGAGVGLKDLLFSVGLPLASNFPAMAIVTVVAVAIGVFRLFVQRDPHRRDGTDDDWADDRGGAPDERPRSRPARRPAGPREERAGARDPRDQAPARARREPPGGRAERGGPERGNPERAPRERGGAAPGRPERGRPGPANAARGEQPQRRGPGADPRDQGRGAPPRRRPPRGDDDRRR